MHCTVLYCECTCTCIINSILYMYVIPGFTLYFHVLYYNSLLFTNVLFVHFVLYICITDVPVFASKPHFLDADNVYREYLSNESDIKPDRDRHDTFCIIEPVSYKEPLDLSGFDVLYTVQS